jgi:hypothetical protein
MLRTSAFLKDLANGKRVCNFITLTTQIQDFFRGKKQKKRKKMQKEFFSVETVFLANSTFFHFFNVEFFVFAL